MANQSVLRVVQPELTAPSINDGAVTMHLLRSSVGVSPGMNAQEVFRVSYNNTTTQKAENVLIPIHPDSPFRERLGVKTVDGRGFALVCEPGNAQAAAAEIAQLFSKPLFQEKMAIGIQHLRPVDAAGKETAERGAHIAFTEYTEDGERSPNVARFIGKSLEPGAIRRDLMSRGNQVPATAVSMHGIHVTCGL